MVLRRPVVVLPILGALFYALMSWDIGDTTRFALRGLFATGVVVYYGRVALQVSETLLEHLSHEDGDRRGFVQAATLPIFQIGAQVVVYGGCTYFVLLAWNVDVSAWIASAGIVGIAVGFAAKDTLANLFAGVFILADRPYKLNDYLLLETGERGRVTRIGIRTTRLQTNDDVEVIIPNAEIANARIVNESGGRHEKFRIRTVVEVAYGSDIEVVREVLMEIALTTRHVVVGDQEVRPRVRFMLFGASGLEFHLLVWVPEPRYKNYVIDQLNTNIYKRFNEMGIEIPYSKHEVFLRRIEDVSDSD
ncbi:MAG: mechanosensitive ion channel family protein [Proteobacteria bacterium]|nr:mechanosensitive ion channel family protein [Pseudomonadota bacterium]MCP4916588.1 mechanosensitive ion channel family protein [Pseudomonadota bacterium]